MQKNEIENALINQNLRHYKKAMKTKVFNNKIY